MKYKELVTYTDNELIYLLNNGMSEERVYSAWVLGLRSVKHIKEIEKQSVMAPNPGTRRYLIPILAGMKKIDILLVLVKSDPSELVRATALEYLHNIDFNHIIELVISLYKDEKSKEILNVVFRVLEARKYKLSYTELLEELDRLDYKKNNKFLTYLFNIYSPNKLPKEYVSRLLKSKYILNNKSNIIHWLSTYLDNNDLILLLSGLGESTYMEYLKFLYSEKIYLELNIHTLKKLPLVEEADAILYEILKIDDEDAFVHLYLYRLKIYFFGNIHLYSRYRDYFDEMVENIVEGIKDYELSKDEKDTILRILKTEYKNLNFEYDIDEDKEYYLNEINKLSRIFSI